ncbi:NUDIX hydrolase domain containing protein [Aphelenchoides bicaudatus]|nr:NUDIX hydrolase domain containing protein [Aphelenchoides bicaudatus]
MVTDNENPTEALRDRLKDVLLSNIYYKSSEPKHKAIKSEASVLILLDRREDEWYVFLTQRSEKLRTYAGEVSFPGGKREPSDQTFIETALREAHEETGIPFQNVEVIGVCMPILSKLQVFVHPVFAYLKTPFDPQPNDEVQKCFWLPLRYFLLEKYQKMVILGPQNLRLHKFAFPGDVVYGLTAHLCILAAMLVINEYPEFPFIIYEITAEDRRKPITQFVREHFDIEYKTNLNFVLDLQEYSQKGKAK